MIDLLASSPIFFISFVFAFSLLVGSFLNVVIYRLPVMMKNAWQDEVDFHVHGPEHKIERPVFNLVKPDSTCPNCSHQIRAWENIPLVSWLVLKGKCSKCKSSISARYPLIELLTAGLSAWAAYQLGFNIVGISFVLATWLLVAMTFIDLDEMLLPDSLTLSLLWLGLIIAVFRPDLSTSDAIFGAVIGYMSLFSVYWGFKLLTGKEGMGYGDFKLLAALGAWCGWQQLPIIILLSSVVGAFVGLCLMAIKRQGGSYAIPFGPYLAAAGFLTVLYGDQIAQWYLSTI